MVKIKKALISVSDKNGIIEFAKFLETKGVEILSTGGTLKALRDNGVLATAVEDYTGFPEMLGGRVKTLHPKIHGGLLGNLDIPEHRDQMEKHSIPSIDLVVVNLYPFVETVKKPDVSLEEVIENIDIGGPSMLRSGAKNYKHTVVVTEVSDYRTVQAEMEKNDGSVSVETSFSLAVKVFNNTAVYDSAISQYLTQVKGEKFPDKLSIAYTKKQKLRYGENPHQDAAFYEPILLKNDFTPLQGKELSFNNMLDFDAAFHISAQLPDNAVTIIKHLNPCGIAFGDTPLESFLMARRTDPISAFGAIIGVNGVIDGKLAKAITENFVEGIICRQFTTEAREVLSKKTNIRLIEIANFTKALNLLDYKSTHHGMLVQDMDFATVKDNELKVVSKLQPSDDDMEALKFAWTVVKYIKSNAIVYTDQHSTIGIGAGQMSRVDSVELGAAKAQKVGLSVVGSYVGSDAFFPFRDGIDAIAKVGAKAIIQPGGSIRDEEVIQAADEHGLIMVFTGMRHFRH
jgi:phosphoribosylaminoimidazolecarboxamide formyltransferase / IMP cyclohydrolase